MIVLVVAFLLWYERPKPATRISVSKPVYVSVGTAIVVMIAGSVAGASAAAKSSNNLVQGMVNQSALTPVNKPLPDITLTNQNGKKVSLSSFRRRAVVLTFLDPVCYDECPVIAQEMRQADQLLGPYADKVQMVAVVGNPLFHSVKDVQRFDQEEGLGSMTNWTFLTSNNVSELKHAWNQLYEYVSIPRLGMVVHAFNMYFISPSGQEVWLSNAQGDTDTSSSYSTFIADYAEKLLGVTIPINGAKNVNSPNANSRLAHPAGFDSIQMTSQSTGWATAFVDPYQQILRTTDGGKTWKDVTVYGITQRGGILLAPVSDSTAWGLVPQVGHLKYSALFKTTDGGIHWSHVGYAGPTPKMYGSNGLSVTPDGGVLWLTGKSNSTGSVYLYRSTDHAATWKPVTLNLDVNGQSTTTEPITWTSANDGTLTVKVNQGSQETVVTFTTQNGGQTWTEVPSHQTLNTSAFVDNPLIQGSQSGTQAVWKTVAGASTTSPSVVQSGSRYVYALNNTHMWSIRTVGNHTQVFQSSDGGKTWTEVASDRQLSKKAPPIS